MAREPIKLILVDDHPVFRDGLRQCLEARKTLRVIAAVGGGEELWKAIRTHGVPHAILMDVEMPGEGGIELTKILHEKHPEVRVVMLTAFSDSERVFAALKAGAVGYLLKNSSFTPFFTTKESGTGLGLAIAREFVTAHGGRIDVEDAAGGGARFVIRLPRSTVP